MMMATASKTRTKILDVAEDMLRTRGFNAFSYQDISEQVGIRKASIHYHFPTKEDLGLALLERFGADVKNWASGVVEKSPTEQLEAYFEMTENIISSTTNICVYGVMGTEFWTLPEAMQEAFKKFQRRRDRWLAKILEEGRAQGVFKEVGTPEDQATLIAAAIQGGLQIARSSGEPDRLKSVLRQVRESVLVDS